MEKDTRPYKQPPEWWRMLRLTWRERQAQRLSRRPEPSVVMDDPGQVAAFHLLGRGQGSIQPIYYFNALRLSQMTPPGGLVVDFGSGSGQFLRYFAQMRKDVKLLGFDLSDEMIALGNQMLQKADLTGRVRLIKGDMTTFKVPEDEKVHVVSSIFALHHLPSAKELKLCLERMTAIREEHGAGIWIFDHVRPHHPETAADYPEIVMKDAPAVLLKDSQNSLIASWSFEEMTENLDMSHMGMFSHEKVVLLFGLYQSHYLFPRGMKANSARHTLRLDLQIAEIHAQSSLEQIAFSTPQRMLSLIRMLGRMIAAIFQSGFADLFSQVSGSRRMQEAIGHILTQELGKLKGPLMKLGQIAGLSSPKLSAEVRRNLGTLVDTSATIESPVIRAIVERELKRPIAEIFEEWSDAPFACGVVAQLHYAILKGGRPVMVKVRYPGLVKAVKSDLKTLKRLRPVFKHIVGMDNFDEVFAELHTLITAECDFLREAKNQAVFRRIFKDDPDIVIPDVFLEFCTEEVLVMEYVDGQRFRDFLVQSTQDQKNRAGEVIWRFVATSLHKACILNADPHPGNFLFLDGKVVFLDFGFVKRWQVEFIENTKRQALAICERDVESFANATRNLGYVIDDSQCDYPKLMQAYRETTGRPWCDDEEFRFTSDFIFNKLNNIAVWQKQLKLTLLPEEFVAYVRLYWGLFSVLTRLNANANWHSILVPTLKDRSCAPAAFE